MTTPFHSFSHWFCFSEVPKELPSELPSESFALRWCLAGVLECVHLPVPPESLQFEISAEVTFLEHCAELARLEACAFSNEESLALLSQSRAKVAQQCEILFANNLSSFKAFQPHSHVFRIFVALALTQLEWINETEFLKKEPEERMLLMLESPLFSLPLLLESGMT